jgi:hypothetical protein
MSALTDFLKSMGGPQRLDTGETDPYGKNPSLLNPDDNYSKVTLPLMTILGAITSHGKGTAVQDQLGLMKQAKSADLDSRAKAMERQLGMEQVAKKKKFESDAAAPGADLSKLYAGYQPEEAGKIQFTADQKLRELMQHPERMTDFQRKVNAIKQANPDMSDQDVLKMALVPSSQVGASQEKIEGAGKVAEAQALGANTDEAAAAKAKTAATVKTAEIDPSLQLEGGKAAIDVNKAADIAKQSFDITKDQSKKQVQYLLGLGDKVPAQGRSASGLVTAAGAAVGTDAAVKNYNDMFGAVIGNFARAYGGEKGVLTDADIKRMGAFKYSVFDTPEERKGKQAFMKTLTDKNVTPEMIPQILNQTYGATKTPGKTSGITGAAVPEYATEEEARAAGHKGGDRVKIGGRTGTLTD